METASSVQNDTLNRTWDSNVGLTILGLVLSELLGGSEFRSSRMRLRRGG